ncbi:MAG: hypothetical protein Q7S96_03105 [bacterium]|nr:hypothetical protein [bacterium]
MEEQQEYGMQSSQKAPRRRVPAKRVGAFGTASVMKPSAAPASVHALTPWAVAVAAVVVLALVVFGVVSVPGATPPSAWSAVFLTNGQVYFGHLTERTRESLVLRDVYYLQVSPSLQQRDAGQPEPPPNVALVKLGSELHGPTDEMQINREHVLFTESLRDNSTVVQGILAASAEQRVAEEPNPLEQAPEGTGAPDAAPSAADASAGE